MSVKKCKFALFFLLFATVINCDVLINSNELKEEIETVINHLNSKPYTIYKYNYAKLINAHKKADVIELNLDVNVDCIRTYPNLPCAETVLNCLAFVQNPENAPSQILGDAKCKPKIEPVDVEQEAPTTSSDNFQPQQTNLVLSNEAVTNTFEDGGDHFVAIRRDSVPCLGCPIDLKSNADGVEELTDLALRHIESERNDKHALVKVLRLQQQIVSGVKYILLIEVAPTTCPKNTGTVCPISENAESLTCEVTYLQKPWISKAKHIISNNCTTSQEFVLPTNDIGNEVINGGATYKRKTGSHIKNSNFDQMAENGVIIEEMPAERLSDLESQILTGFDEVKPQVEVKIIDEFIVPSTVESQVYEMPTVVFDNAEIVPTVIQYGESFPEMKQIEATVAGVGGGEQSTVKSEMKRKSSSEESDFSSGSEEKRDKRDTEESKSSESDEKREKRDTNESKSSESEEKREKRGTPNSKSSDSSESNETKEKHDLQKSVESKSSDSNSDETKETRQKRAVRQLEKISQEEKPLIQNLADFAANALDAIDDDNHKRVILQILGAKKLTNIDDGTYYHLILRMGVSRCLEDKIYEINCREKLLENFTKNCKVQIHVTDEYDSPNLVKSQCQNIKRNKTHSNRTNFSRFKRGIPGGVSEFDKNHPMVSEFLTDALNHLDANSQESNKHKIVEVSKATKQVVSGMLYTIDTKISISDCSKNDNKNVENCGVLKDSSPKNCKITVWEQLWLKKREYTIKCDQEEYKFQKTVSAKKRKRDLKSLEYLKNLDKFSYFTEIYNKTYFTYKEFKYRLKVFVNNLEYIKLLKKHEQGTAKYGITQFSDLTSEEFSKMHGLRTNLRNENDLSFPQAEIPQDPIPIEFDWRKKGVVTEVKNQGQCGSCWAFSVTGNIEGQYAIKHGKLLEFSEQELVDCDKEDQGCNGGLMDTAYRQIEKMGGLETEQDYPYEAEDEKCHFQKSKSKVQLSGAVNISQDETDMAKWLVKNGPISIAINANAMQFYVGGVSHPFKFLCNPKNLDHGVLIVGYGVHTYPKFKKSLPYWIVKNSWGPSWGEQGYYRVYRGDGTCGVNQTPSSAIVV